MKYNKHYSPHGDDTGNIDAGDASARLYNINEENIDKTANQQRTGLKPGEDVADLRAAEHGNPNAPLDGDTEEVTGKDDENDSEAA